MIAIGGRGGIRVVIGQQGGCERRIIDNLAANKSADENTRKPPVEFVVRWRRLSGLMSKKAACGVFFGVAVPSQMSTWSKRSAFVDHKLHCGSARLCKAASAFIISLMPASDTINGNCRSCFEDIRYIEGTELVQVGPRFSLVASDSRKTPVARNVVALEGKSSCGRQH